MKTPKFLSKLSAVLTPRPKKKLQATARAARHTMEDYDAEEPTTKLSSAFIVVLILHVVAVGGIYAFNSIKASRRDRDTVSKPAEVVAPVAKNAPSADKAVPQEKAPAAVNAAAANRKVEPANPAVAPAPPAAANATIAANAGNAGNAGKPVATRHQVKSGENLTKIAIAYRTTAAEIMAANQLKEGAVLRQGQSLIIPPAKTAVSGAEAQKTTATPATTAAPKATDVPPTRTTPGLYTVKKGDTMTSIAKIYGLSVEELSKANKNTDPKKLQLGQVLKLPPRKG
jgi:LysM repeat protein